MKKSLVITLALVFVLGIAGAAMANPFSDVPANHWAYGSISKLAEAGIVEGYGNGRFVGSATITRYEAAQIIAKALARSDKADAASKAQIDRLAAEFAKELQSLGVRVGRLEKRIDNVTIIGEARFSYKSFRGSNRDYHYDGEETGMIRTRLYLTGQVNDSWKYTGMFEHNGMNFKTNAHGGQNAIMLRRGWVDGKLGVINVTAGDFNYYTGYGAVMDNDFTGLKLNYKDTKWDIDVFAGRPEAYNGIYYYSDQLDVTPLAPLPSISNQTKMYGVHMRYAFNDKFNAMFAWYGMDSSREDLIDADGNIFEIGLDYKFTDELKVWGEFITAGDEISVRGNSVTGITKNGFAGGITYSNKDLKKAGSFDVHAGYYKVPNLGVIAPTHELYTPGMFGYGYKGFNIGASYVVAKNIDLNVDYYDFKSVTTPASVGESDSKMLWSYVRFYF